MNEQFGSARSREIGGANLDIRCFEAPHHGGLELCIFGHFNGKHFSVEDMPAKEVGLYEQTGPALIINHVEAQGLMDSLWNAGIRPKSGEGSVGQLAATERHLNDMRAMVASFSKTKLP